MRATGDVIGGMVGAAFFLFPIAWCQAAVAQLESASLPDEGERGNAPPLGAGSPDAPPVDANAPLPPLPGMDLAWPDMETRAGIPPTVPTAPPMPSVPVPSPPPLKGAQQTTESGDPRAVRMAMPEDRDRAFRVSVQVNGLDDGISSLSGRFDTLSQLKANEDRPSNLAQIRRRARDDRALLVELLRSEGYYGASVGQSVQPDGHRIGVVFTVAPGPVFRFERVTVNGLPAAEAADLRNRMKVAPGLPIKAEDVLLGQAALSTRLAETGYPFAVIATPDIEIDHSRARGDFTQSVETGPQRRFGTIQVEPGSPFDARHVWTIARFRPGDVYDQARVEDLRRALTATGVVGTATLTPQPEDGDQVRLDTDLIPAKLRTLAGTLGYGSGEGVRGEASWQHRAFVRPEGALTLRAVAGTREQLVSGGIRFGNFRKRDQVLDTRMAISRTNYHAYSARTMELSAILTRESTLLWQKRWTYSLGVQGLGSDERDFLTQPVGPRQLSSRRTFIIAALPGWIGYDASDDLLNPQNGFRVYYRASPELSLHNRAFAYVRNELEGMAYWPAGSWLVMAGRAKVGSTMGAKRGNIAPSRRFYAGGGGSVRGYAYQRIGPRNAEGKPIGGRALAEFSAEARIRTPWFGGNLGLVPFVDGGMVYRDSRIRLNHFRYGAGLGVRYYSSFGPFRLDVATPLNRRPDESRLALYISLGQAF